MMHDGDVMVVPSDGDGVPVRFSDLTTVAGITSPTNAASGFELSRLGGSHYFGFPLSRSLAAVAFRRARLAASSAFLSVLVFFASAAFAFFAAAASSLASRARNRSV